MASAAFTGPYTDPNITYKDLDHVSLNPDPPYENNPSQVTVYDVAGRVVADFSHTAAPPFAPNKWVVGRDAYSNTGAPTQDFLYND